MRLGLGSLDEEIMLVQSLRAAPPGFAGRDAERKAVFGAALHQFEQLLTASARAGAASSPLLLFYALSQAGRAIAAAHCPDSRWDYQSHGLRVIEDRGSFADTVIEPVPRRDGRDAFSVVADAVGSAPLTSKCRAGDLWASIPESDLVVDAHSSVAAILLQPDGGSVSIFAHLDVPEAHTSSTEWETSLSRRFRRYPHVGVFEVRGPIHSDGRVVGLIVAFPAADRRSYRLLSDMGEAVWDAQTRFLRPALNDAGDLPNVFMSWWALLLTLSHYARYVPGAWAELLARDSSPYAVPLERTLATARREMPRRVLHAITGRWE